MQIIQSVPRRRILPPGLESILPPQLNDALRRLAGAGMPEELRLHADRTATATISGQNRSTGVILHRADMKELLLRACSGSLYAYRDTINRGYLAMADGVRVGVCGSAAVENGRVIGVSDITGLMFRIPHTVRVDPAPILEVLRAEQLLRGVLIFAPPGVGKTTLLRAVTREAAKCWRTVAVDTRCELAQGLDGEDLNLDILSGYPRDVGLEIAVRCMAAQIAVCDEIGGMRDAQAILSAANHGVPLVATAHAASPEELLRRRDIRLLHRAGVFGAYIGLRRTSAASGGFLFQTVRREEIRVDDA